jgi:hypothetical protein
MSRRLWHQHFTPTSSSWHNQVERSFALLAEKQIKRGAHRSVKELIAVIGQFINCQSEVQAVPLPKSADDISGVHERLRWVVQRKLDAERERDRSVILG